MSTSDDDLPPFSDEPAPAADDTVADDLDSTEDLDDEVVADDPAVADGGTAGRSWWKRVVIGVGAFLGAVLSIVLVMAVWPASTSGLGSQPDPAATFDEAVERFESLTADEPGVVFEPCESVLMDHGEATEVAVVLFHGLTNCPEQFIEFGEMLHDDGCQRADPARSASRHRQRNRRCDRESLEHRWARCCRAP